MPEEITQPESKLRYRVEQLEKDMKALSKGLKRAAQEIQSEWGEEIVPEGTDIAGTKF